MQIPLPLALQRAFPASSFEADTHQLLSGKSNWCFHNSEEHDTSVQLVEKKAGTCRSPYKRNCSARDDGRRSTGFKGNMAAGNICSVLVTGANRGIGLEMVKHFLGKATPPKVIFAGCRDPEGARAKVSCCNVFVAEFEDRKSVPPPSQIDQQNKTRCYARLQCARCLWPLSFLSRHIVHIWRNIPQGEGLHLI